MRSRARVTTLELAVTVVLWPRRRRRGSALGEAAVDRM